MTDASPLLGAYAAKQCPVRLFRQYDPTEIADAAPPDDDLQQLFDDGIAFEIDVVAEIVRLHAPGEVVVIPGRDELNHEERRELTRVALDASTPIICGALMEPDVDARRLGEIDILVSTGRTVSGSGRPEYRAIDVKSHRCTKNLDDPADLDGGVTDLHLLTPGVVSGLEPKYREDDCLQLAHYHRLLQATGHAEADDDTHAVSGGILGSESVVAWFDLQRPQWATITPQIVRGDDGESIGYHRRGRSTKRTTLDRYDFEFAFRLKVVDTALQRVDRSVEPIVHPVKVKECLRCDWRDVCDADMRERDDVSLVKSVGYPEWRVHRFMGVDTCSQLAELDPDEAVERYADTPLTETALRTQINEARSAVAGRPIVRPTWDKAAVPRGDLEIDLDMENADHVYLWGAFLSKVPADWPEAAGSYVAFASFDPLDEIGERALAGRLWAWLRDLLDRADDEGLTARVYFYSAVETTMLRRLVPSDDLEAVVSSDRWVDLFPLMKQKFWSNWGHGLKITAAASGFAWRDDDPGGYASMQWYADAMDDVERDANIERILAYNEDDCRATAALRDPMT
ncbi:MAG: TM0106 family RecB-like putative nuclease [Ilumatobacter sp.]|uniref:TM0106 family RecB-like putative nuclease n=1 Tax=Ilumatobacter sp. TaxID=1967498 RepID=UPI003C78311F